jgi:hypothetical protein
VFYSPQCLPILIHKPASLAGKLPGLENIEPPQQNTAEGKALRARSMYYQNYQSQSRLLSGVPIPLYRSAGFSIIYLS